MSYSYPPTQPPNWSELPGQPQPPRKSGWTWVALIFGGLGIFGLLVCCGGGVWLMSFGMNVIAVEIEDQLSDNPKLAEHVGEIQEFKMDFTRSFSDEDDDTFVYSVKGTKASGRVTVKHVTDDDGSEVIESASLRLDSGTTVQLVP